MGFNCGIIEQIKHIIFDALKLYVRRRFVNVYGTSLQCKHVVQVTGLHPVMFYSILLFNKWKFVDVCTAAANDYLDNRFVCILFLRLID